MLTPSEPAGWGEKGNRREDYRYHEPCEGGE